ncbi:bacteriocin [uncultured Lactobacillus sp.]|uniref:bacteriocin n=1 Tax=uncultured Lactobacillus sp. TaxID=153152 RepID=UPI002804A2AA|nr:bacteriocin [uncultured Lactobacillus sp.]
MKAIKVMKNKELEEVIGGSLYEVKNAVPRLLGPDGMEGTMGGSSCTGGIQTFRHFSGFGR